VSLDVANATVVVSLVAPDLLMVSVAAAEPALPSVTVTSAIDKVGDATRTGVEDADAAPEAFVAVTRHAMSWPVSEARIP
jgi:hypothetical protein